MFQDFTTHADPSRGPARLAGLRRILKNERLAGFIVPRADAHQGEYVADADKRLEWLTGFTGSAGFCIALTEVAGVFIDGRYRNQVRTQIDLTAFTPVNWPEVKPAEWLREHLPRGGRIGFDAWLHTRGEVEAIRAGLEGTEIELIPTDNLIDRIWRDRPAPPHGPIEKHPLEYAGITHAVKRSELAQKLRRAGQRAAVLTLSDSIAWLLNIRGSDIPHVPVVQGFAILHDDERVDFFTHPGREDHGIGEHLGDAVSLHPTDAFAEALGALAGPVRVDPDTAPLAVSQILTRAGIEVAFAQDPCILPKARKNQTEIRGARAAHLRDAVAVVEFLAWYDETVLNTPLTEIDLVTDLEARRRAGNALLDISFETIAGTGPHGAIMHYRVTEDTNRPLKRGDLVVLDSGGQYRDGTTDITRTLPVGEVGEEEKACFTRVLQGMIALSRLRWPAGLAGQHIDAIARAPLWMAHQDFDHGTGHGVGSYLSVHEGPQRISRISDVVLEPGMILSNEPGYYRDGAFGIRIENLVLVRDATRPEGGDDRDMLDFETLTLVPIDRRLILPDMLSAGEIAWLNAYHREVADRLALNLVSERARNWLAEACAPI